MAEAIWYYAVDDQEKGPVTPAQLKSLADAGRIKPDDLVWREGIEDWKPAGDVSGLFTAGASKAAATAAAAAPAAGPAAPPPAAASAEPAAPATDEPLPAATPAAEPVERFRRSSVPSVGRPTGRSAPLESLWQPLSLGRYVGQPLLLVGLILVLLAKGCDSVGNRYVQQIEAKLQIQQNEFQDQWDSDRSEIEDERDALQASGELSDEDRVRLQNLNDDLTQLNERKQKERKQLEDNDWRDLRNATRDASSANKVAAYYREAVFVFGTIVLTLGLLAVGFTGEGAQKWICLIMLAIITFSLYVGGSAWIGSWMGLVR